MRTLTLREGVLEDPNQFTGMLKSEKVKKFSSSFKTIERITISCFFLRFVPFFKNSIFKNINVHKSKRRACF